MIWTVILRFLKDPKILTIIGLAGTIIFLKLEIWSIENDIREANILNSDLNLKLNTSRSNLHEAVDVNGANMIIIDECIENTSKLNRSYIEIIENKEKLILGLRSTISELSKPVVYPETIVYKECKIKIKNQEVIDESDITFNSISNIGH